MQKNYYEILGASFNSSIEDIKKIYRKIVKQIHPDVSGENYDRDEFIIINEAYRVLSNPKQRIYYNQKLLNIPIVKMQKDKNNYKIIYSRSLEILARRGFLNPLLPRSKRKLVDLEYDIILVIDKTKTAEFVSFIIDVPTKVICPICNRQDNYCAMCGGKGYLIRPFKVKINTPPNIKFGEIFEVKLCNIKQRNLRVFRAQKIRIKVIFMHHLIDYKK